LKLQCRKYGRLLNLSFTRIRRNIQEKINTNLAGESPAFMIINLKLKLMNRSLPFGYNPIGNVTVVKLNVNLNWNDALTLQEKYKNILVCSTGRKNIRRLEGVLSYEDFQGFHKDLEIFKIDYKVGALLERKVAIVSPIPNDLVYMNDFPF